MKWYYTVLGGHTHVRVFMNGGKCGDLCFRNEEFDDIRRKVGGPYGHYAIAFLEDHETNSFNSMRPAPEPEPTPRQLDELRTKLVRAEADRDREARKVDQLELELMRLRSISNP